MKVAYIAGPYRAETISGVRENIEAARWVAEEYWRRGFAVVCPHLNSAFMDGVVPDAAFIEGDLCIIGRCDLVVMAPGWQDSAGARREREVAEALRIPVEEFNV